MDETLRFLSEKAQALTMGENAVSKEAYHTIVTTIAGLDEAKAKRVLFQAIVLATAGVKFISLHSGQDAFRILDGLSIESEESP